jgi:ElaB/YqjD/DUF883 family membrane-anchored ribosome-binding protein
MRTGMRNGALQSPLKSLRKDLHAVARDAEALLRATADVSGDRIQEARERTEQTVRQAFDHLYDRGLQRQMRSAARSTSNYVRDHSWSIIGVAAGVGLLLGLWARRGGDED